jgi:hypothetical protein
MSVWNGLIWLNTGHSSIPDSSEYGNGTTDSNYERQGIS